MKKKPAILLILSGLFFCNAVLGGSGKATLIYYSPHVWDNKIDSQGFPYTVHIKNGEIMEFDIKSKAPTPPLVTLSQGTTANALTYDAAGNLYYVVESERPHMSKPYNSKIIKIDVVTKEISEFFSIFPPEGNTTGGNPDSSYDPSGASLAYDSTRNVLAYYSPHVWDDKIDSQGSPYAVHIKNGEIKEFDIKSNAPIIPPLVTLSQGATASALTYDADGNLYYVETSERPYNSKVKKIDIVTKKITNPFSIYNATGGNPDSSYDPSGASLAYDPTRNVIAYYSPHVWDDKIDSQGIPYTVHIKDGEIMEFDIKSKPPTPTSPPLVTLSQGVTVSALTYDAAGNLYYVVESERPHQSKPYNSKIIKIDVVTKEITDFFPIYNATGGNPDSSYDPSGASLAYDPGQRIYLDWQTPLPVQVCAKPDITENKLEIIFPVYDCSKTCIPFYEAVGAEGCDCKAKPAQSVTFRGTTYTTTPCPAGPDKVSSFQEHNAMREKVAGLYAQSGAALPVLTSDTFPDLLKPSGISGLVSKYFGSAYGSLAIDDAVRVRTAHDRPRSNPGGDLNGKAYELTDKCNKRTRADNVAIFGTPSDRTNKKDQEGKVYQTGLDQLSITTAHEVGHALGLRHVLAQPGPQLPGVNNQGGDIMDYIRNLPLKELLFDPAPLQITEAPRVGGDTSDANGPFGKSNPKFHLLAYSLDFDPVQLETKDFVAGAYDISCQVSKNNQKLWSWIDFSVDTNILLSDFVVLEINGVDQDNDEGSSQQPIDGAKKIDLTEPFRISTDQPIRIVASTKNGGIYDVAFGIGDPNNPRTEFNNNDTNIAGSIFQYNGSGAAPKVIGSFTATLKPMTEPDLRVDLAGSSIQAIPNEQFAFTTTVTNIGAAVAHSPQLQITLDPNFFLSSVTPTGASCTGTSLIICDLGDLKIYDKLSFNFIGDSASIGKLVTSAAVSTSDQEVTQSNNSVSLSTKVAPALAGDINGDGVVNLNDLNILNGHLNQPSADEGDPLDINKDGVINALDARKMTLLCTNPRCS